MISVPFHFVVVYSVVGCKVGFKMSGGVGARVDDSVVEGPALKVLPGCLVFCGCLGGFEMGVVP